MSASEQQLGAEIDALVIQNAALRSQVQVLQSQIAELKKSAEKQEPRKSKK